MAKFKEKLLVVETLNEQQKMRLLEQMAYELKKASGPPEAEVLPTPGHAARKFILLVGWPWVATLGRRRRFLTKRRQNTSHESAARVAETTRHTRPGTTNERQTGRGVWR